MKRLHLFLAALALAFLTACAGLDITPPQTFNQKALAAHKTVTTIAQSATTLRAAGKLGDADRANIVSTLKAAESGIDLATELAKTDATAGSTKLELQIKVLTALQLYLATKEK